MHVQVTPKSVRCLVLLMSFLVAGSAFPSEPNVWTPFAGNPIITDFPHTFDAFRVSTVMKEGGLYKLWGGQNHIQYATSTDGIMWSSPIFLPGLGAGAGDSFDRTSLFGASVIHNESLGIYQMWYTGQRLTGFSDFRIGYATSPDGINWTKVPGTGTGGCVIDKESVGSGEGEKVQQPVVLLEDSVYKMWYHGSDPPGSNRSGIFYAESNDGVNWTKIGKVMDRGPSGAFDFGGTYPRTIIAGDEYRLWYEIDNDQSIIHHTAYATSTDGINWTKHGLIPFPDEPWCTSPPPTCTPQFVHVVESGSSLEAWYQKFTGSTVDVGYATAILNEPCVDNDGDGYGDPGNDSCDCQCPDTDCDDDNIFVFPGATEDCNGIDDDCDGESDEGFDQDGDHVADCFDNCPDVPNAQTDADGDGAGDACDVCPFDPDDDADADGVCGDVDVCSDTEIPEAVPTVRLNPNHWALTDRDHVFDTVKKGHGHGSGRGYTTIDTSGCSCEQIIDALGLGEGHRKHGCSNSAMDDWISQLP